MSEAQKVLFIPLSEFERTLTQCYEVIKLEREARGKAELANRQKDAFLAIVSHEMRNTLNPIIGWTKLLRSGKTDECGIRQAIEAIERSAKIQKQLVNDLLDAAQISNGKLHLNFKEFKVVSVIENVMLNIQPAAEAKQIRLTRKIDPNLGSIIADPRRLEQVLLNLFSNSLKFTPPGGKIEIKARPTATGIELSVTDSGRGISAGYLPFVFEQFSQENEKDDEKGCGLGLSIARQIINRQGGTITAESAGRDAGATFVIKLPKVCTPDS
jgi:signal transduction histidine kinase